MTTKAMPFHLLVLHDWSSTPHGRTSSNIITMQALVGKIMNFTMQTKTMNTDLYRQILGTVLMEETVAPEAKRLIREYRTRYGITDDEHSLVLTQLGWTTEEFEDGFKQEVLPEGAPTAEVFRSLIKKTTQIHQNEIREELEAEVGRRVLEQEQGETRPVVEGARGGSHKPHRTLSDGTVGILRKMTATLIRRNTEEMARIQEEIQKEKEAAAIKDAAAAEAADALAHAAAITLVEANVKPSKET